ncbi:hypothetical protein BDW02DRAFT_641905 [Decorospora gaudefroyi]|uniref:Uncharacterized protein n=1 Tax=Decorospora gaudefroyi TaxID=184978 RepID=A0A6A5K3Z2_9PLEO|nr:hypothetical protein BDW02DRAFT_641905 [Decorospora gaudefroyi]
MTQFKSRNTSGAPLGTTAIVAIISSIGVTLLCALAILVIRLIQVRKTHKKLLADLEERGVRITRAQVEARKESVARPRTVLRRNTVLPFNKASGWGALTSHGNPPAVKRNNRLSWPFSARRLSDHGVQMNKIKASRLSTVIEDPKPSPLVPILSSSHLNASRPSLTLSREYASRPSSCQSLLQDHPAFRNQEQGLAEGRVATRESPQVNGRVNGSIRLIRARSVAEVPSATPPRPQIRARSTSLCSQLSGKASDVILPPLPLGTARIKSEAKRRSQLRHAPSQLSISSFGSADTSILATRLSPVVPQSTKFSGPKITKPNAKGSAIAGGRSFRDTLDLRTRMLGSRVNVSSDDTVSDTVISSEIRNMQINEETQTTVSNRHSHGPAARAHALALSKVKAPSASPRSVTAPKRRSKTLVTSAGSPERQCPPSNTSRNMAGAIRSPKRQHSQTSSRNSGGNPFQWDPTPLSPGHRRKNSVRISLVPTIHGPPSRTPSPSLATNKDREIAAATNPTGLGFGSSSTRSLPTPPNSSTFAPDVKFTATSLRASLTLTSPAIPLVGCDQAYVVSPTYHILPHLSEREQKRLSTGSIFSLSRMAAANSIIEPIESGMTEPVSLPSSQAYNSDGNWMPETPFLQQYPFGAPMSDPDRSPSQTSMIDIEEYDPERPSCIYQTPTNTVPRAFQSGFATIPEESSVSSQQTLDVGTSRYDDSPAVSPKTFSPPRFTLDAQSAYNLPIHATAIPEEPLDTIDPSFLSKDAFSMLNTSFNDGNVTIFHWPDNTRASIAIPTTPGSARSMFEPLLEAALPSRQSSSVYTQPSPSPSPTSSPIELPSPIFPCSPRPTHAQLPTQNLSINFEQVPKLSPSPRGPRASPPCPLRSSIAALRRMNSDAADAKKAKGGWGERRYLKLGREDSMQIPGDESWLEDLDDGAAVELDEEEGRRLVGSILEDGDDGCTVLDLSDDSTMTSVSTVKPEAPPTIEDIKQQQEEDEDEDTTAGASHRSSSIWEDGENFWTSNTPPPPSRTSSPISTTHKPKPHYPSLPSSPLAPPSPSKRVFEVAKDAQQHAITSAPSGKKRRESNSSSNSARRQGGAGAGSRYRKRSALGPSTPDVRIQITSPSGVVVGAGGAGFGTPGSLYDGRGFLRS